MDERGRYLVEIAPPEGGWARLQQATARARTAAAEMRAEGLPVRFVRSVFTPEDVTCYFLFEAPSAQAVEDALGRAALHAEHLVRMNRVEPGGGLS